MAEQWFLHVSSPDYVHKVAKATTEGEVGRAVIVGPFPSKEVVYEWTTKYSIHGVIVLGATPGRVAAAQTPKVTAADIGIVLGKLPGEYHEVFEFLYHNGFGGDNTPGSCPIAQYLKKSFPEQSVEVTPRRIRVGIVAYSPTPYQANLIQTFDKACALRGVAGKTFVEGIAQPSEKVTFGFHT